VVILTCSPGAEGEEAAVEGISFPFGKEEAAGISFVEAGASDAAGAGLLELVFIFFEGGSTKPSSLHKNVCIYIRHMGKSTQINLQNKRETLTSQRAGHPLRRSRLMASSAVERRTFPELHQQNERDQHHCHVDLTPMYRLIRHQGFYDVRQKEHWG
jgi:hypothetical protein